MKEATRQIGEPLPHMQYGGSVQEVFASFYSRASLITLLVSLSIKFGGPGEGYRSKGSAPP